MSLLARVHIPITPLVEANSRKAEHWAAKKRRADAVKESVFLNLNKLPVEKRTSLRKESKVMVKFTAITSYKPDADNLAGALKHYRDEVARFLKVDDGNEERVAWSYHWMRYDQNGHSNMCGVRIDFIRYADFLVEAKADIERQLAELGLRP